MRLPLLLVMVGVAGFSQNFANGFKYLRLVPETIHPMGPAPAPTLTPMEQRTFFGTPAKARVCSAPLVEMPIRKDVRYTIKVAPASPVDRMPRTEGLAPPCPTSKQRLEPNAPR